MFMLPTKSGIIGASLLLFGAIMIGLVRSLNIMNLDPSVTALDINVYILVFIGAALISLVALRRRNEKSRKREYGKVILATYCLFVLTLFFYFILELLLNWIAIVFFNTDLYGLFFEYRPNWISYNEYYIYVTMTFFSALFTFIVIKSLSSTHVRCYERRMVHPYWAKMAFKKFWSPFYFLTSWVFATTVVAWPQL